MQSSRHGDPRADDGMVQFFEGSDGSMVKVEYAEEVEPLAHWEVWLINHDLWWNHD